MQERERESVTRGLKAIEVLSIINATEQKAVHVPEIDQFCREQEQFCLVETHHHQRNYGSAKRTNSQRARKEFKSFNIF